MLHQSVRTSKKNLSDAKKELERREQAKQAKIKETEQNILKDKEAWGLAQRTHTVDGYKRYLNKYDKFPPEYRGEYVAEAEAAIEDLERELIKLRNELFKAMREQPWAFNSIAMKSLFDGVSDTDTLSNLRTKRDITSKFLASGQSITYQDLIDEKIISNKISQNSLIAQDQALQQTNIQDLGSFPKDKRTDVYFLGVPRGGKSSVLAGVLANMYNRGCAIYQPHYNNDNQDLVSKYYYALIESTRKGKFPQSTADDTISFMKLDLNLHKRNNPLIFVEVAGEVFRKAEESGKKGKEAWGEMGAGSCINGKNRKLLLFIVDYSLSVNGAINPLSTEFKQSQILDTLLRILSNDGDGNTEKNCTLSKVDTVAVIVTKSDLMHCEHDKRTQCAMRYLNNTFAQFMTNLRQKCQKFGINKPVGNDPYIMAFSLGKLLVGNTYEYDPKDSEEIVNFISYTTSGQSTGFFGTLFSK